MKKLIAFLSVLITSILCTACINNFAVQELNNKAKEYLDNGDIQSAICRLQSSIDLDANVYETRYNLAVAYIKNEDFVQAKEQIDAALKLNSDDANAHYSLGIIGEGLAQGIIEGKNHKKINVAKDSQEEKIQGNKDGETDSELVQNLLSKDEINTVISSLEDAVNGYNTYILKKPEAEDKAEVKERVEEIKEKIEQYRAKLATAEAIEKETAQE